MGGGGLGILIWLGVLLTENINLARHGEVRVAADLDTAPAGKDGQYLPSFNVGSERILAVFLTFGIWFARVDARDFHDLSYFRSGMYPPPWDPPIIRRQPVTGRTRGISVRRRGRRR
jgi:hypothetical protein